MPTRREFLSTAVAAAESIRKRSVSPVELTKRCLDRIQQLNPTLNAFITVMADEALAQARQLESERAPRSPLHGIPIALKDLIDTAGVKTTAASAVYANRVPTEDAEVVKRLKAAGAIILGKLNMHEFAYGATSVFTHYGPVRNPRNPDYITGGSSGGSAAAVAAEMCFGALGSDTGGSIRQPAAYCGIVGLKPTYGRVSTRGVIPLAWSLDHIGPMCRTVADTAMLLQALAGYDPLDSNSVDTLVPDYSQFLKTKTSNLRLGIPRKVFYENVDPEIAAAIEKATAVLSRLTAGVRDVQLPELPQTRILSAEAWAYHAEMMAKTPELYQPDVRGRLQNGQQVPASEYIAQRRDLDRIRRAVRGVFREVDLLITPTTPVLPVTIEEAKANPITRQSPSLRNTNPFDHYALPTISIPCGVSSKGLPIGLQISGAPFAEIQVLALAHAYEQATKG